MALDSCGAEAYEVWFSQQVWPRQIGCPDGVHLGFERCVVRAGTGADQGVHGLGIERLMTLVSEFVGESPDGTRMAIAGVVVRARMGVDQGMSHLGGEVSVAPVNESH